MSTVRHHESLDVMTIGESLVCLSPVDGRLATATTLRRSMGGAESNTAIGLARLGHAAAAVTRVGRDPFGEQIIETLRTEGVDVAHVIRSPDQPTGVMFKDRRGGDDIEVHYYRAGSAASRLTEADVPAAAVAAARRVHLCGITLALGDGPGRAVHRVLSICRSRGIPVSFDPNHREKLWPVAVAVPAYTAVLPAVSDLLVNEREAIAMTGTTDLEAAGRSLLEAGCAAVVIKCGARGVTGWCDGSRVTLPARTDLPVVDTVGAGDAFNAGFLHGRLLGDDFRSCLRRGILVAARAVAADGDYEGLPLRAQHELDMTRLDAAAS